MLLIGDSILDQEGSAAAFLLRQHGVDAKAIGVWGSGIIGIDQYDNGKPKPGGYWFHRAQKEVAAFLPDVVGVYMNHSYWPPYPHDAAGTPITDLSSRAGQTMISQQARGLITILRAHGAEVFFITPAPVATSGDPDPGVSNPIWRGYVPVLRAMHVMTADTARALETTGGLRAETKPSCDGTPARVRPADDVHLTRFGAGLAGSALASYVADLVHVSLRGNAAPGAATTALVPTRSGRGYWLVGCDGSIFHFGDASALAGMHEAIAQHGRATAAVAAPSGTGLWIIAADGTVVAAGDAPPLVLSPRPQSGIVAAATFENGNATWAVTASGAVATAGRVPAYPGRRAASTIVGIAATPSGQGYWVVDRAGAVRTFGDARPEPATSTPRVGGAPIAGIAATPDGRGYWLTADDGGVYAFGNARMLGTAAWRPPTNPADADTPPPGPTVGIVAAKGTEPGYWIFGATGRVTSRGAAGEYGGDNNLARATQ